LGAKQRFGQLAAPYLRNVFDVRSSAKPDRVQVDSARSFPTGQFLGTVESRRNAIISDGEDTIQIRRETPR
jgi:hypothetical protein